MCSFRERRSWGYECIVRGHRCTTFPSRRRICEENMRLAMAPGAEVVVSFNPETRRLEKQLTFIHPLRRLHT